MSLLLVWTSLRLLKVCWRVLAGMRWSMYGIKGAVILERKHA